MIVPGLFNYTYSQSFQHPGIDQNTADLVRMKQWVSEGKQPYKDAFLKLKAEAEKPFTVTTHTRVMRGPYGKPNIGGEDLRLSANMAYNNALLWYITGEKKYASKSIEIIKGNHIKIVNNIDRLYWYCNDDPPKNVPESFFFTVD